MTGDWEGKQTYIREKGKKNIVLSLVIEIETDKCNRLKELTIEPTVSQVRA